MPPKEKSSKKPVKKGVKKKPSKTNNKKGKGSSKNTKKGRKSSKIKGKDSKNKSKSVTSVGSGGVSALASTATPEQIAKNKAILEKVCALLEKTKPEQVTRSTKDDLNKIQQIIKNIAMRDNGDTDRVREVPLTEKQKAIIQKITGFNCDEVDTLTMTITEGIETNTPKEESLEKVKEEKLDLEPTK